MSRYIYCVRAPVCHRPQERYQAGSQAAGLVLLLMMAALKMVKTNGSLDRHNQFVCINSLFSWDFFYNHHP